jgi:putative ABC transport system permease protein
VRVFRLLSLRRLRRQPMRVGVAVVAVAAGVSLAVGVLTVTSSIDTSVRDFGRTLAGPAPLRVVGATSRGGLPIDVVNMVAATDGVASVVPMVQSVTLADRADGEGEPINVLALGVDCSIEALLGEVGCNDAALAAVGSAPALVGESLQRELGAAGTVRTDTGRVSLDNVLAVPELEVLNGGRVVIFTLAGAQERFAKPGQVDVAYVQPTPGTDVDELQDRLEVAVGDHLGVLTRDDPPPGIESILATFLPLFALLGLFALGTGAALVYNTVSLTLEERRRVLAVIGALGARRRTLLVGTIVETGLLGLVGGAVGTLGGFLLATPITASLSDVTEAIAGISLDVHASPALAVVGILLGGVVGAGAAVVPAWRATRLDVAAELSGRARVAEARPVRLGRRIAIWGVLGAIGVLGCWASQIDGGIHPWQVTVGPIGFLILAVSAPMFGSALAPLLLGRLSPAAGRSRRAGVRLAVANLVRDPRRTGVMAAAVTAAIITAFTTDGFINSARETIETDFTRELEGVSVSTIGPNEGADAFVSPAAMAAIDALPGTGPIRRGTFMAVGHEGGSITGVNAYEGSIFDADDAFLGTADDDRLAAGEVIVGPRVARDDGVRPGDTVRLDTPTGQVHLPVQGVWYSGDFGGRNVTMSYAQLEELYGPQPASFLNVVPEAGVTMEELAATLRAAAPSIDPELQVRLPQELGREIVDSIETQMGPFRVMQQGLLFVAFIAILSTLLLVGVQRQREMGMLAAVGSRPGALARMVLGEAAGVGLVAVFMSAVFGPVLLWSFQQLVPVIIGFRDPFSPDWSGFVVSSAIAFVVAIVAAAWPAWRASRIEVLEALRYE